MNLFEPQLVLLMEALMEEFRERVIREHCFVVNAMGADFDWQVEAAHMSYRAALEALQEENARLRVAAGLPSDQNVVGSHPPANSADSANAEIPMEPAILGWIKGTKMPIFGETRVAQKWGDLAERAEMAAQARAQGSAAFQRPAEQQVAVVGSLKSLQESSEDTGQRRGLTKSRTVSLKEILHRQTREAHHQWRSSGCFGRLVMRPYDPMRLAWDMVGTIFLMYDFIMFPIQAMGPPELSWMFYLKLLTTTYWCIDLPSQFFLGFHNGNSGYVEMKPWPIARHYLRTWFLIDLTIVSLDVFFLIITMFEGLADVLRMGKTVRFLRILRTLRLLRSGRVLGIFRKLEDQINREWCLMLIKVLKLLFALLLINHYLGCAFYYLSNDLSEESEPRWVSHYDVNERSFEWRYLTALQWSLAQFTPSASEIQPKNPSERVFSVLVVMFGMVCFSSFVSSITSTIQQLRTYNGESALQEHNLRQFLLHNAVSADLCMRIWDYVRSSSIAAKRSRIQEKDAKLLMELPHGLLSETRAEVYAPVIIAHPMFQYLAEDNLPAFYDVCYHAMAQRSVMMNRELFLRGTKCSSMFFVVEGVLKYDTGTYPKITDEDQAWLSMMTGNSDEVPEGHGHFILPGRWVSEPALWLNKWMHKGSTVVLSHVEAFEVSVVHFAKATAEVPCVRQYRDGFIKLLKTHHWDDLCSEPKQISHIADCSFPHLKQAKRQRSQGSSGLGYTGTTLHNTMAPFRLLVGWDSAKEEVKQEEEPDANTLSRL
mmetsp:Transcript_42725/g.110471  ORF Transcript_42725/g.110471 Transcript_42725/m.110471 type:complete len:768 (+) Transcript_42725:3-2306(+)